MGRLPDPASVGPWPAGRPARLCTRSHTAAHTHTHACAHTHVSDFHGFNTVPVARLTTGSPIPQHLAADGAGQSPHSAHGLVRKEHGFRQSSSPPPFPIQAGVPSSHIFVPGRRLRLVHPVFYSLRRGPSSPWPGGSTHQEDPSSLLSPTQGETQDPGKGSPFSCRVALSQCVAG